MEAMALYLINAVDGHFKKVELLLYGTMHIIKHNNANFFKY